jgi:hypothetical protein
MQQPGFCCCKLVLNVALSTKEAPSIERGANLKRNFGLNESIPLSKKGLHGFPFPDCPLSGLNLDCIGLNYRKLAPLQPATVFLHPGETPPGYPLQVLAPRTSVPSLWAFRYYPWLGVSTTILGLKFKPKDRRNSVQIENSKFETSLLFRTILLRK